MRLALCPCIATVTPAAQVGWTTPEPDRRPRAASEQLASEPSPRT